MSDTPPAIEPARVAQLFGRRAPGAAFIVGEVGGRMAERLDYIRIDAPRILDAGCGDGVQHALLAARFPDSALIGIDVALAPLARFVPAPGPARRWLERFGVQAAPQRRAVCADLRWLPLARASTDMVWSNLVLHWSNEPHLAIAEWGRVLRPEGLAMFSAFGPDTLNEVRTLFAAADVAPHTVAFTDMHDYGDMLVASGFAAPVVDMERITLTYSDIAALWRDVRALGGNPLAERRRALWGRAARARLTEAIEAARGADGQWRLTFEVIYGHAWKGVPRVSADGRAVVRIERPAARGSA